MTEKESLNELSELKMLGLVKYKELLTLEHVTIPPVLENLHDGEQEKGRDKTDELYSALAFNHHTS